VLYPDEQLFPLYPGRTTVPEDMNCVTKTTANPVSKKDMVRRRRRGRRR